MLACEYLRRVLVPSCKGRVRMDSAKCTVVDLIHYHCEEANYTFAFEHQNRLEKIGNVIPPDADLYVLQFYHDGQQRLFGNAIKEDVRVECAICMDVVTNFVLHCGHCFHEKCLSGWKERTCPMCRAAYTRRDNVELLHEYNKRHRRVVIIFLDD
jgi:hypothetical protein